MAQTAWMTIGMVRPVMLLYRARHIVDPFGAVVLMLSPSANWPPVKLTPPPQTTVPAGQAIWPPVSNGLRAP